MLVVRRLLGTVLVVAGATLIGVGSWFASNLGSSGEATFVARAPERGSLVLEPAVLNRTDLPIRIDVAPVAGDELMLAIGTPTDARSALGDSTHHFVAGVIVRDWIATVKERGVGDAADLGGLDLWRQTQRITEPTTLTIRQDSAPETLVIAPVDDGSIARVTLTWAKQTWFVQALFMVGTGVVIAVVGALMFLPTRSTRAARHERRERREREKVQAARSPESTSAEVSA